MEISAQFNKIAELVKATGFQDLRTTQERVGGLTEEANKNGLAVVGFPVKPTHEAIKTPWQYLFVYDPARIEVATFNSKDDLHNQKYTEIGKAQKPISEPTIFFGYRKKTS